MYILKTEPQYMMNSLTCLKKKKSLVLTKCVSFSTFGQSAVITKNKTNVSTVTTSHSLF